MNSALHTDVDIEIARSADDVWNVVTGRRTVTPTSPTAAVFTYDVELEPDRIPRPARPVLRWWLQRSLQGDLATLRTMLETKS